MNAQATPSALIIGSNLLRPKRRYEIGLETADNKLFWVHEAPRFFEGTEAQKDIYIEKLVEQSAMQGLPLVKVHVVDIDSRLGG